MNKKDRIHELSYIRKKELYDKDDSVKFISGLIEDLK